MKKIILAIMMGVTIFSCTKNEEILTSETSTSEMKISTNEFVYNDDDFDQLLEFSRLHRLGLQHNIDAFIASKESFTNASGEMDEIKLLNFFEKETHKFLASQNISVEGALINTNPNSYLVPSETMKVEATFSNTEENPSTSESFKKYSLKLKDVGNESQNIDIFKLKVREIFEEYKSDLNNIPDDEHKAISMMIGIAYDSYDFWHNVSDFDNTGRAIGGGVYWADFSSGYGWAAMGLAGGPLGAIVCGINGAIIGSCIAYGLS